MSSSDSDWFPGGGISLEAAVDPKSSLRPVDELTRRWTDLFNWVCAIEDGLGKIGTGTLVGIDLVLTNYHVVEALFRNPSGFDKARVRFDFREDSTNRLVHQGRPVEFAPNWSKDLPNSAIGMQYRQGIDSDPNWLDYAVIRLADPVGNQAVANPADSNAPERSWMTLPDALLDLRPEAEIRVLQHPLDAASNTASPCKESRGKILELVHSGLRVRHNATTFGGSSGGAVVDGDFNLIALHQAGNSVKLWNQAIPISAIVHHMKQNGFGHMVGVPPPPRRRATAAPSAIVLAEAEKRHQAERRLRNIKILMDRDDAENAINAARDDRVPGLVHLIACRGIDCHPNFLEKLVHLSLDELSTEAKQRREAALLGIAGSKGVQPWAKATLRWPGKNFAAAQALRMIMKDLAEHLRARARRRIILEAVIMAGDWDPSRDPELIAGLAAYLRKEKVAANRMQIFVVCTDAALQGEPDQYRDLRKQLREIWKPKPPPGCGVALELPDVGSNDLSGWRDSLVTAFKLDPQKITEEIGRALPGDRRVPMLVAEADVVRQVGPLLENTG